MVQEQKYMILTIELGIKEDWVYEYSPDAGRQILGSTVIAKLRKAVNYCADLGYCKKYTVGYPYMYDFTDSFIENWDSLKSEHKF